MVLDAANGAQGVPVGSEGMHHPAIILLKPCPRLQIIHVFRNVVQNEASLKERSAKEVGDCGIKVLESTAPAPRIKIMLSNLIKSLWILLEFLEREQGRYGRKLFTLQNFVKIQ